jgi:iron complex transport system permease protein
MKMNNKILLVVCLILISTLVIYGETGLSFNESIVWQLRIPKIIVCIFAGGMLAISGLLMQIFFQNPLAGPDLLGVSSGSSLFVAIWLMGTTRFSQTFIDLGMTFVSFLGAMSVFLLLFFFIKKNDSKITLIVAGLLISAFASSGISILINAGQVLQLKNYLSWSMGSFRNVTNSDLLKFVFLSIGAMLPFLFFTKALNQFMLSETYAKSMGVNVKRMKLVFISIAALQVSIVTMYCGPIGFIGIIGPHLARNFLKTSNLNRLVPATFLLGAILALFTEFIIVLTPSFGITVNSILGLMGAPIIVYYLYNNKKLGEL